MKKLIVVLLLGLLSLIAGCASLNNAGTAKYSVEPIITDNGPICCRVLVENGKEYATLKAHVERRADGSYVVDLDEKTVKAFEGQAKVAETAGAAAKAAATLGAAVLNP